MGPRALLASLLCLAVHSLSCGALFTGADSRPALPPVVMAPDPDPSGAPPAREETPRSAQVVEIAEFLATRHTGLLRDEIDALAGTIVDEARRHRLDPTLVLAVMHVESRYNNFALSPVGAVGLMQILPSTGEALAAKEGIVWAGTRTLLEPTTNVRLGVAYLRELADRYGDLPTALAAYNWGPGHIDWRLQTGTALPTEYPSLVLAAHAARRDPPVRSRPARSTRVEPPKPAAPPVAQGASRAAVSAAGVATSATKRSIPFIAASAEPR
jgi:hypothetical protein